MSIEILESYRKPMKGWSKEEWAKKLELWAKEDRRIFDILGCPEWALMVWDERLE